MTSLRLASAGFVVALLAACGGGAQDNRPKDPPDVLGDGTAPGKSPQVAQGIKAIEEGRYDEARSYLAAATQMNPKDFEATYYLAVAYEHLNQRLAAETYYKRTLVLVPGDPGASANLSAIFLEDKRSDEARDLCRKALEKNPQKDADKLHFNLARALADKGDKDGATAAFEKAIALSSDMPDYHLGYGHWLARWGKRDQGLDQVRQALVSARDNIEMLHLIGINFRVLRAPEECVKTFDRVLAAKDTASAHFERGVCKMAVKDGAGAETDLRAAIGLDPKAIEAHYWLGVLLTAKKDYRGAAAEYDAVTQLDPSSEIAKKATEKRLALPPR